MRHLLCRETLSAFLIQVFQEYPTFTFCYVVMEAFTEIASIHAQYRNIKEFTHQFDHIYNYINREYLTTTKFLDYIRDAKTDDILNIIDKCRYNNHVQISYNVPFRATSFISIFPHDIHICDKTDFHSQQYQFIAKNGVTDFFSRMIKWMSRKRCEISREFQVLATIWI